MSVWNQFVESRRTKTAATPALSARCPAAASCGRRFQSDEGGNIAIMAGIMLPVAIAAVGAAISFSTGNATRTSMQMALDSAVLAGVAQLDATNSANAIDTAQNAFQSNVNKFAQSSASQITASFAADGSVLSGKASGLVANPFGGLLGTKKTYLATATAAATKATIPVCVLGLNGLDNGAFDINGGPTFNADCAVQANSNSKTGMTQEGKSAVARAKKFGVSGGHKTETFAPPPSDGSAKIADPYASVPFPPYDSCDAAKGAAKKGLDIKVDTTLSPGTYCGGIHADGSSPRVTLLPGVYVMVDGSFWIDGGAVVTGDQVMIAFTGKGAALQIWGDSSVNLTSPTSGTYMNMQFFQNRDDTDSRGLWNSIGGNSGGKDSTAKLQIDGVAYFPTQNFWVFGRAALNANSPSMAVVADKIWVQGNATFNVTTANPRKLPVAAAPTTSYGARLIN